jgi:hypothetical protein
MRLARPGGAIGAAEKNPLAQIVRAGVLDGRRWRRRAAAEGGRWGGLGQCWDLAHLQPLACSIST